MHPFDLEGVIRMSETPIRVLVVDDHAMVRSGLTAFLLIHDDLALVGEAGSGEEAIRQAAELQPDVILMDVMMPDMNGAQAAAIIRQQHPQIQIVALTSFKDDDLMRAMLNAGVLGFLFKNASADELAAAIKAAHAGKATLAPEAQQALIHALAESRTPAFGADLTEREREVLKLMVKGMNNPDIADALVISRSTVKFHVSSILSKLGVASRTEAVALAVEHHLT